jgi:hypothetical protein
MKKVILIVFILGCIIYSSFSAQDKISLSGKWQFAMDPMDQGIREKWFSKSFNEAVLLPGSMTENGKGYDISLATHWTGSIIDSSFFKLPEYARYRRPDNFKVPFWHQPVKNYYGAAWYKKEIEIPAGWKDKPIELFFERCHWQSALWIDDNFIGTQNSLGAPHIFNLTEKLSPGKHTITLCVDNRIKEINPGVNSSSLTDHSQTNWNGIIGRMYITAKNKIHIGDIRIFPDVINKKALAEVQVLNSETENIKIKLSIAVEPAGATQKDQTFKVIEREVELKSGENIINVDYSIGSNALLWDEFNPNLYKLKCKLTYNNSDDSKEEIFGLRKLGTKGTQFTNNDKIIFLRGTLECAIFPKTGYPSTNIDEWLRIFKICKNYGLNHMRFHSWCPPEAAFIAADNVGIYLHVECSSWANQGSSLGDGKPIDKYIYEESERIVKAFGNHPSFCFLLYGNEPDGINHQKYLTDFVSYWKKKDNRRLYSGAAGWPQLEVNDFHSMYEPRIQLWGAGLTSIINSQPPSSNFDWYNIINWRGKPVISHEIGQWCVYPNFKEIKKYDGVLHAKNFEIFEQTLTDNGMTQLADSFLIASGKLQVLCYKEEIEAALRTKGMGGFQLLDLHDFPGQGTALVGVLDPFWEEKGYVTPEEYRHFCNTTVPLARMSKFIFNSEEDFKADIEISNFSPEPIQEIIPVWTIIDENGNAITEGKLTKSNIPIDNGIKLGSIKIPLSKFKTPAMYTLVVNVGKFRNQWDFWVYPYEIPEKIFTNEIKIVHQLDDDIINFINKGGKVLLTSRKGSIKPEKGGDVAVGFSSIFWNTAWTQKQAPHTLGILCNPKHPLFNEFPTQFHSNYQWWDAMSHSNAIYLKELGVNIQPVVRIIDDWFTARPLGLVVEAKVGKGKVIISGIDLLTDSEKRPEARQLIYSIIKYMQSDSFNPAQEVKVEKIKDLFNN